MRKTTLLPYLLLYLLVVACGPGEPEDPWETIELGTDAEFRDIFFTDARNGWIVGSAGIRVPGGIIGRTRDGGSTWEFQTGLISKRSGSHSIDMNAVHFVDEMTGTIAAESGVVLGTADGGESWKRVAASGPIYAHNRAIAFIDARQGWLLGRQGVRHTADGGATWKRVDEGRETTGNAIAFTSPQRGWIVGKFGDVQRTADGGVTWEEVAALGDVSGLKGDDLPTFTAVHFADEDHGWIAGYRREMTLLDQTDHAVILHTRDGGRTWKHQLEGVESLLRDICFADAGRGWAVGYDTGASTAVILATTNGGNDWTVAKTITGEKLLALHVKDGAVWTVGDRVGDQPQRLWRLVPPAGNGVALDLE